MSPPSFPCWQFRLFCLRSVSHAFILLLSSYLSIRPSARGLETHLTAGPRKGAPEWHSFHRTGHCPVREPKQTAEPAASLSSAWICGTGRVRHSRPRGGSLDSATTSCRSCTYAGRAPCFHERVMLALQARESKGGAIRVPIPQPQSQTELEERGPVHVCTRCRGGHLGATWARLSSARLTEREFSLLGLVFSERECHPDTSLWRCYLGPRSPVSNMSHPKCTLCSFGAQQLIS